MAVNRPTPSRPPAFIFIFIDCVFIYWKEGKGRRGVKALGGYRRVHCGSVHPVGRGIVSELRSVAPGSTRPAETFRKDFPQVWLFATCTSQHFVGVYNLRTLEKAGRREGRFATLKSKWSEGRTLCNFEIRMGNGPRTPCNGPRTPCKKNVA
jgi:hypothetical protein